MPKAVRTVLSSYDDLPCEPEDVLLVESRTVKKGGISAYKKHTLAVWYIKRDGDDG